MRGACAADDPWHSYRQKFRVFFREASSGVVSFGRLTVDFEPEKQRMSGHFSTAFYRHLIGI